ncbi:MAG: hypothetical protein OXI80_03250 [Caldilineaceae bacterium]|nr:hypothetical protein [Caldilineaceae bacterium]
MTQSIKGPSSEKPYAVAKAPRQALAGLGGRPVSISNPNAPGRAGNNAMDTYM